MKNKLVMLFLFVCGFVSAQANVNRYQYVIVPSQFKFESTPDAYKLNTLTKLLLEKYGFKVFFDTDILPAEIADSKCDKLYTDVVNSGNFIMTKMKVTLKDCNNKVVYETAIGKSKEKEYRVAYTKALREAFQSFDSLKYHYVAVENAPTVYKTKQATTETLIMSETFDDHDPMLLYAQPIANGYQLVDATPKVVMKLFKTSNPETFTASKGSLQGVLIAKDNQWFFEYYKEEKMVSEKINVKF